MAKSTAPQVRKPRVSKEALDLRKLSEDILAHEINLENAKEEIDEMKVGFEQLRPKAPDWLKLIGITASILVTILTGWWYLGQKISERPTFQVLDAQIQKHEETAEHPKIAKEVESIKKEQNEQRRLLDKLDYNVQGLVDSVKDLNNEMKRNTR